MGAGDHRASRRRRMLAGAALALMVALSPAGARAGEPPRPAPIQLEDDDGPVVAELPPTAEAALGQRLFAEGRWAEAAPVLHRIARGETGDGPRQIQLGEYRLAVALHELDLPTPSLGVFSTIAAHHQHAAHLGAMRWLARLAWELPGSPAVIEAIGNYGGGQIQQLAGPGFQWDRDTLRYWAGRYHYRDRRFEEAIACFDAVDRSSPLFFKAQIFTGMAFTLLRKKIPGVKAFQKVMVAVDDLPRPSPEEQRLRDLAEISTARAYYNNTIPEPDSRVGAIDANRLSAAVKYWQRVRPESEHWRAALLESSWGYFMAGDYPHAIGNLYTYRSPFFPEAIVPEADLLEGIIQFTICDYDGAITLAMRMRRDGARKRRDLEAAVAAIRADGGEARLWEQLEAARDGKPTRAAWPRPEIALADRSILRFVDQARELGREMTALDRSPAALRSSALGLEIRAELTEARALVPHTAAKLARERYERTLAELQATLLDGEKLLLDVAAGQAEARQNPLRTDDELTYGQVTPDEEHFIWPFDGEYWRDELGSYRAVVHSRCSR